MKQLLQRLALMAMALCAPLAAQAQVSLTGGTYSQNFDSLSNTAGSTTNNLPAGMAGWLMTETGGGTRDNEQYAVDTGSGNTGDTYSYGAAGGTDRAFGGLRSGTLVPVFGACFTNNTGVSLSSFDIAYTGEQWRLGTAARSDQLDFQYSLNNNSLTTGTWLDVNTLDFATPNTVAPTGVKVGNDAANRTARSATVSSAAIANGSTFCIRWNDLDASGADDGLAIDDFSITVSGTPLPTLSINDVTQAEGDSGTTDFVFTVTLSAAAASNVTVNYATGSDSATSATDFSATAGTATITTGNTSTTFIVQVLGDTALETNETFLVTLGSPSANATIGDAQGIGTITNDDIVITSIGVIQGSGELSPSDGQLRMTEGVVTAKRGNGFFLQSFGAGAAAADGNAATSDGIFVFTSAAPNMVAVGDHARVTGTVDEFSGSAATPTTELVSPSVVVLGNSIALPTPIELTAALAGPDSLPVTLEHLEGMRASVAAGVVSAQTTGNINSEANATSSDGNTAFELVVTGVPRPLREEGISIFDPFPVPPAKQATIPYFDANQERIKAFPLTGTRLVADAGATVTGLVGVLTYFGDSWELLYDLANPPAIGAATATAVSDPGANDITIGGFNLQRFFDTANDPDIGEPVLTTTAFANRLAKTGAAICDWVKAPDILGVVEVENIEALTELANYINGNCASTPAYVPYLQEGNDPGGIDVGFLVSNRTVRAGLARVQVASVTQHGKDTLYGESPVGCTPGAPGCTSNELNDRPSLVLRAAVNFTDGRNYPLTVIVNHLRSLNGNDDPATNRVRFKRAEQAMELANLVNGLQLANPNEKIVLVGDFNAFPFNDGYVDLMGIIAGNAAPEAEVIEYRASPLATPLVLGDALIADPAHRYSYVFEGNAQTLDHAVVNQALVDDPAVTGLAIEHARINADFRVSHYGQFSLPYSASNPPLRVSDHDPVRLTIGVVRPLSADLSLAWTTRSMSSTGGALTMLTLRNSGPAPIVGTQVRIDLTMPANSTATVAPPSGWTCQRLGDSSFLCTATTAVSPGFNYLFGVSVRPRQVLATDTIRFKAQATVQSDPISGDNSAVHVLP